jgi:hypothetical protein
MKKLNTIAAITFGLLSTGLVNQASAASIKLDTRSITTSVNNTDYQSSWFAQSSAIASNALSDVNGAVGGNQTFSHLTIDFSTLAGNWGFQIAPDAGFGGALYLDGQLIDKKTADLWWGGSWSDPTQILSSTSNVLVAGAHVFEAYWAEACCNGSIGGRFSANNVRGQNQWESLTTANLNKYAIPSPDAIWLIALGLLTIPLIKKKESDRLASVSC